jgi:hypothetical protein
MFSVTIKKPDGKPHSLSSDEFKIAQPLIVDMMNGKLRRKEAEKKINEALGFAVPESV